MSTPEATTLADFAAPEPEPEQTPLAEQPVDFSDGDRSQGENRCQNCGSFVTRDFARVFGNNHNEVFGCLECMTATEVKKGGARAEDADTDIVGGMEPLR